MLTGSFTFGMSVSMGKNVLYPDSLSFKATLNAKNYFNEPDQPANTLWNQRLREEEGEGLIFLSGGLHLFAVTWRSKFIEWQRMSMEREKDQTPPGGWNYYSRLE